METGDTKWITCAGLFYVTRDVYAGRRLIFSLSCPTQKIGYGHSRATGQQASILQSDAFYPGLCNGDYICGCRSFSFFLQTVGDAGRSYIKADRYRAGGHYPGIWGLEDLQGCPKKLLAKE